MQGLHKDILELGPFLADRIHGLDDWDKIKLLTNEDAMRATMVARQFRFSQQQIIEINYHYSRIAEGSFDEDNVRLLLIHLREFLRSNHADNPGALGRANAKLLREIGDGVAHTVRTEGEWWSVLNALARQFAHRSEANGHEHAPFVMFDLDDIIEAFRNILHDTRPSK